MDHTAAQRLEGKDVEPIGTWTFVRLHEEDLQSGSVFVELALIVWPVQRIDCFCDCFVTETTTRPLLCPLLGGVVQDVVFESLCRASAFGLLYRRLHSFCVRRVDGCIVALLYAAADARHSRVERLSYLHN